MLVHVLETGDADDFEVYQANEDNRGPLGGRSQQVVGVFTDALDRKHGVIINAYVGEPDISLDEHGEVQGHGR